MTFHAKMAMPDSQRYHWNFFLIFLAPFNLFMLICLLFIDLERKIMIFAWMQDTSKPSNLLYSSLFLLNFVRFYGHEFELQVSYSSFLKELILENSSCSTQKVKSSIFSNNQNSDRRARWIGWISWRFPQVF